MPGAKGKLKLYISHNSLPQLSDSVRVAKGPTPSL